MSQLSTSVSTGGALTPNKARLKRHCTKQTNARTTARFKPDVVRSLTRGNFYKFMTTRADHRVWQDVYHAAAPAGKVAYIKVTDQGEGMPPLIRFKEL